MVLAGNKAKQLSLVNHTTNTIYHHHHHRHHEESEYFSNLSMCSFVFVSADFALVNSGRVLQMLDHED